MPNIDSNGPLIGVFEGLSFQRWLEAAKPATRPLLDINNTPCQLPHLATPYHTALQVRASKPAGLALRLAARLHSRENCIGATEYRAWPFLKIIQEPKRWHGGTCWRSTKISPVHTLKSNSLKIRPSHLFHQIHCALSF